MKGVILAAGEGKRLKPLTTYAPKVMIPVGNKPVIEYIIESLVKNNIRDIVIVIGYYGDKIKRYFGNGEKFNATIKYVVQDKQLGTSHALYQVHKIPEFGNFIVLPGDNIIGEDGIKRIMDSEKNTILAVYSERASKYGAIEINSRVKIKEKENIEESLIFTGIAHLDSEIFGIIEENLKNGIYNLPEVLNTIEDLKVIRFNGVWEDAVYPWDLLSLNSSSLKRITKIISGKVENSTITGNVEIGEGSIIRSGSRIMGPVKIGDNCEIGANSVIVGDTSIGDRVKIGSLSYIENSIIMDGVIIGEGAYIKDSIIGIGTTIMPRFTSLSGNFRKLINGDIIEYRAGAVIGDNTIVGAGVIFAPGVLIGADCKIGNLKIIRDDLENGESVR